MVTRRRPRRLAACAGALLLAIAPGTAAGQHAPTEYQLKAVFLYSFTKYVRWPDERAGGRTTPLDLCILGEDPFGEALDAAVEGETVRGAPVSTRRIGSVAAVDGCHVLFVSDSETANLGEILASLDGRSILTVGESPRFAERGGIIGMIARTNRIGLAINVAAADRSGLTISSQLLKLGEIVGKAKARP